MSEIKTVNLTKDDFAKLVLESPQPVLVDFWAEWCAPCRRVAPIVEQLAETFEGRVRVGKVDVDAEPELGRKHDITSIPSLLIFREGEVVERIVGARSLEELTGLLERALDVA